MTEPDFICPTCGGKLAECGHLQKAWSADEIAQRHTELKEGGFLVTEPDFDRIARQLVGVTIPTMDDAAAQRIMAIAEQLRQVWNARGAADIAQLQEAKAAAPPFPQAATYVQLFGRAIKALDR